MAGFADGATIKINDVAATISAAEQQADHAVIHYTISPAVQAGDVVTWEYDGTGNIAAEAGGAALADVTAQTVTNNVSGGGDPIGDALRADVVAYWLMDEESGSRLDSTSHHHDALFNNGGSEATTLGSIAGKFGNAVQIFDSPEAYPYLDNSTISISPDILTLTCWVKVNALTGGNANKSSNQSFDAMVIFNNNFDALRGSVVAARENNSIYILPNYASEVTISEPVADIVGIDISPDVWYFTIVEYNFPNNTCKFWLDNVETDFLLNNQVLSGGPTSIATNFPLNYLQFGSTNYISASDWMAIDEAGIWIRALTSDERTRLKSAPLFPAP